MLQAADFHCVLCLRGDSPDAADRSKLRLEQARNLQYRLEDLGNGRLTVERLRERIYLMCGMCQMLMIGIGSENDRFELQERIRKELGNLKEAA